jgi:hypothetical protein
MDLLARMALSRAHSNLSTAIGDANLNSKIKTFAEMRHSIALADSLEQVNFKSSSPEVLLEFREKHMLLGEGVFADAPYAALISAYLDALAPFSVLDSLKRHALVLSPLFPQAITASGYVADVVSEGAPKAVKSISLQRILTPPKKVAAIVVWSDLLDAVVELKALIERMADNAVVRGQNQAVFEVVLENSPTPTAGSASGNALTDLETLIAALPGGRGTVVATSWANVRRLSISAARGPNFTVYGGEFTPGLNIVPTDDLPSGVAMCGIEADRVALADAGLQLRPSRHGSIQLSDEPSTPDANTVMVSLWQNNLRALLTERLFQLAVPEDAVAIITE